MFGGYFAYNSTLTSGKLRKAAQPAFEADRTGGAVARMKGSSMKESKGKKKVEKTKTIAAQPSLKGLTLAPVKGKK